MTSSDSAHIDPIPRELLQQVHRQELEQTPREICDCCDLDVRYCGKAAEAAQRTTLELWRKWLCRRGWFRSNYPGACNQCGTAFRPGSVIRSDGFTGRGGVYVAECCAPDLPDPGSK